MKPYTQIAIEKAKSGGYILSGDTFFVIDNQKNTVKNAYGEGSIYKIFLDPLFWQGLGKAEEWDDSDGALIVRGIWKKYHGREPDGEDELIEYEEHDAPLWKYYWHHFIDTLAEGGTPDEFFEKILTDKK